MTLQDLQARQIYGNAYDDKETIQLAHDIIANEAESWETRIGAMRVIDKVTGEVETDLDTLDSAKAAINEYLGCFPAAKRIADLGREHEFQVDYDAMLTASDAQDMIGLIREIFSGLAADGFDDIWQLTETSIKFGQNDGNMSLIIKTSDNNIAKAIKKALEEEEWIS